VAPHGGIAAINRVYTAADQRAGIVQRDIGIIDRKDRVDQADGHRNRGQPAAESAALPEDPGVLRARIAR
jgi:hypothetical protein